MFPNVFFLQNDFIYVQEFDIYVLGSTMWTDPGDDMDDLYSYNDFRRIKSMTQPYMEKLHKQSVGYLESKLQELKDIESKVVVLTHHLPTYQLIHDKYKGGSISHLFAVELSHWFSKYHIDYWICGHTHSAMDKTIANTRLLVNPVGYPGENRTIHKCYVEIE
jgi:predicted phosphohydrolase